MLLCTVTKLAYILVDTNICEIVWSEKEKKKSKKLAKNRNPKI